VKTAALTGGSTAGGSLDVVHDRAERGKACVAVGGSTAVGIVVLRAREAA
jgi:hypothetical protein